MPLILDNSTADEKLKNFSKDVRELWNMLDEPQEGMTESDLLKKLERLEGVINKFKSDIYEFQHYY